MTRLYHRLLDWIALHWLGESDDKVRSVTEAIHKPMPGGGS